MERISKICLGERWQSKWLNFVSSFDGKIRIEMAPTNPTVKPIGFQKLVAAKPTKLLQWSKQP